MKVEGGSNMSGMGFNTSTRKEDLSTRLKTHNIKRAKDETKKLETESRKMEEKLRELRLAMSKEKEDRERRGGGFWSRGQTGNLNNYATDVLNKPVRSSKDSSGKKKVKILKDTPLDVPERSSQPGTMAFIAKQGENSTPRQTKIKGPKCGQCEERKAAVSCFQCSELYCPGCFASFHLKGALKKHRSIPISAIGPRQCMSPQPSNRDIDDSQILSVEDSSVHSSIASVQKSRNGPEGASVSYDGGPSLLDGTYDERENAAAFQEALMAWRSGGQPQQQSPQKAPTPRKSYTPVKTPTVHMDMGTGTMDDKPDVEIKFNTSNLSYAERLMLKKHRRTELDKVNTPRIGDADSEMSTPRIEYQPFSTSSQQFDRMDTMELTQRERVDFHALYEAVTQAKPPEMGHFDAGDMIITEMDHSPVNFQYEDEEPTNVMIEEVREIQAWSVESESTPPSTRVPPTKMQNKKPPEESKQLRMSSAKESRRTPSVLDEINMNIRESVSRSKSARKRSKDTDDKLDSSNHFNTQDYPDNEIANAVKSIKSRPPSAPKSKQESFVNSRPPSSAKSRPKSSARPGSRAWEDARPSSRFSRASSRMQGEGLLTKSPSEELQKVAMMSHSIMDGVYTSALSNFLMLGVDPSEELQEERTLTPTKHKKQKDDKYKVSNKCKFFLNFRMSIKFTLYIYMYV
ncbi:hypothetical protein KUTeg_013555 [Tegillarca granosa]|uniref:B box-type domain-containing protein n=1 Tax=Tegillarca granosa TaxID=220873 RepID=A0ABQ9EXI9_TEGGR|nr:hypothetical protein KUTeg_013555 [Tegillarca granosa]